MRMDPWIVKRWQWMRSNNASCCSADRPGVSVFAIQPGTVRTALAEELMSSPEGKRYLPWFKQIFDEGKDVSSDQAVELMLYLASGAADKLSGRFFQACEDIRAIVENANTALADDLHVLRLRQ